MPRVASLAAYLIAVLSPAAARADTDPLVMLRSTVLEGGFAAGAICIGDNADDGPNGGVVVLDSVPPGASVVEALLWYTVTNETSTLPANDPTIDGVPLDATLLGSTNRSPLSAMPWTFSFRADVTGIVTGNGSYTLAGFPGSGGGHDGTTLTEGVTIVALYQLSGGPTRGIVIYDGLDVVPQPGLPHSQILTGFGTAVAPVRASWLAIVGNGQPGGFQDPDPLTFNGVDLETVFPTDQVLAGSACPNKLVGRGWWDLGLYDVSSLLPAGATSVTVDLDMQGDLYSVAAYVLAVDAEAPRCGNGDLDPGEECDDGNSTPFDGCTDCRACLGGAIEPLQLRAIRSADGRDVLLSYQGDTDADGYNTWFVADKTDIPCAREGGCGTSPSDCGPSASTVCAHVGAVDPTALGPLLFYQARGTCAGVEAAE